MSYIELLNQTYKIHIYGSRVWSPIGDYVPLTEIKIGGVVEFKRVIVVERNGKYFLRGQKNRKRGEAAVFRCIVRNIDTKTFSQKLIIGESVK